MKRYTVCLQVLDAQLTPEKVKAQVERDILHGRAALYRAGKAGQIAPDKILFEVASEWKPAEVRKYFREREESLAVRVEQLRWGWPVTSAARLMITGMTADPYAATQAQAEESASYTYGRQHFTRYLLHLALDLVTLISILLIIFTPFREYLFSEGRTTMLTCVLQYFIWGYVLFGGRLIPRSYVAYIGCDPEGLEVKYGFWLKPKRLAWNKISELELDLFEVSPWQAVVQTPRTKVKFPSGTEHVNQEATLIKTVIDRASLILAEERGVKLIYRRSDGAAG